MPRSGPGTYSLPPNVPNVQSGTTIQSSWANSFSADMQTTLNTAWPVSLGGTGGTSAITSADALSPKGADIPSASTTDIGAATGDFIHITGTTTITSFGTKTAGVTRKLVFDGALTLTHNATSLILPGGANITTAAGDTAIAVSEGSGNWRVIEYQRANGLGLSGFQATTAKTSAYSVVVGDRNKTILANATSAAFTITLLAAASAGDGFVVTVKKTDSSSNAVTIDANGSETIDGALTYILRSDDEAVTLICDGTGWNVQATATKLGNGSVTTTSAAATVEITGIDADTKEILVDFRALANSASAVFLFRVGNSSLSTTGYQGSGTRFGASSLAGDNSNAGLLFNVPVASTAITGQIVARLLDATTNTWTLTLAGAYDVASGSTNVIGSSVIALSGPLDRIGFAATGGGNISANGKINVRQRK